MAASAASRPSSSRDRLPARSARHVADEQARRQRLHGLPAVEWIAIMRRQHASGRRADRLAVSFTGAENSRLIDSTGAFGDCSNTMVSRRARSSAE